jgi:hypothetical protein
VDNEADNTVLTLKEKVFEKDGIPAREQVLVARGRVLCDRERINNCNLPRPGVVHCLLRILGGKT